MLIHGYRDVAGYRLTRSAHLARAVFVGARPVPRDGREVPAATQAAFLSQMRTNLDAVGGTEHHIAMM